jgi:hypothetical protein
MLLLMCTPTHMHICTVSVSVCLSHEFLSHKAMSMEF